MQRAATSHPPTFALLNNPVWLRGLVYSPGNREFHTVVPCLQGNAEVTLLRRTRSD